ncbi:hypothetical protein [Draconibacterium halophilum]|uniref:Uncharacterized protein n=1 Tax=Draconibacterium halophilum TaxID=2706887 RepID=A0A6C0RGL2_9BACT|nr:hypothetical protein [Draconibacterium halophilum]QIA08211.1 hypothetical protein G0Q07_11000 [Draconibacterium halophilum]
MARGKLIGAAGNHQLYTKQNSKWYYIATSEVASKFVAEKIIKHQFLELG